jgi:hypothetical protein
MLTTASIRGSATSASERGPGSANCACAVPEAIQPNAAITPTRASAERSPMPEPPGLKRGCCAPLETEAVTKAFKETPSRAV